MLKELEHVLHNLYSMISEEGKLRMIVLLVRPIEKNPVKFGLYAVATIILTPRDMNAQFNQFGPRKEDQPCATSLPVLRLNVGSDNPSHSTGNERMQATIATMQCAAYGHRQEGTHRLP
jgi:hypothetical protein